MFLVPPRAPLERQAQDVLEALRPIFYKAAVQRSARPRQPGIGLSRRERLWAPARPSLRALDAQA